MITNKTLKAIEYDKIMALVSSCAVLERTKKDILAFLPITNLTDCVSLLDRTEEAFRLLYEFSLPKIYYFSEIDDELSRVDKGGVLNFSELLKVAENLKSARVIKTAFSSVNDGSFTYLSPVFLELFTSLDLEKDITSKIISEDEISDNASNKLYEIRKSIRDINAKIRSQLASYMRGNSNKFLQDSVVTIRQDRYVIPVKSEYRGQIKGFIHDQSSSGSTVFIEPEMVMELNNDLKKAYFDEKEEIFRILSELSLKVSYVSDALRNNFNNLVYLDGFFARAEFSFKNKCVKPILNDNGIIDVVDARHLLIAKEKVVPISFNLGKDYNFLLITGPNTGGKTVTLKLCGLLSLMAMSGLFLPVKEGSTVSVFDGIYCDIGDEQSIEENLSTFSSHVTNLINIVNSISGKSLVLLDEIGAGTDPEEGSALALSVLDYLVNNNAYGIVTTHYSKLKAYAMDKSKIINACMEFDAKSLKPLYRINIGIPGSSNALDIAKSLGLNKEIIEKAYSFISNDKISFENVLKTAEESRRKSEELINELEKIKAEKEKFLKEIEAEKEKIRLEREKINFNAKLETKRIVSDKLIEAEEIIEELKSILKKVGLESKEVFRASKLKNRLLNSKYNEVSLDEPYELIKIDLSKIKKGDKVYAKSLGTYAIFSFVKSNKKEAEVFVGDIKTVVKVSDLYNREEVKKEKNNVKVKRTLVNPTIVNTEINVVGKNADEALIEVQNFIDNAVVNNYEEVKIIHGVGAGILLKVIREYLKTDKNVLEFRRGKYGEGENGVTIVKLK